ncbi:hypothetical protein [Cellulosimicrobium sp. Marseille-Q4280]|uniref:hypothetical protein n=1 Tax=Cellulosimicrobium sp. Marseille-Q4280 TaxID=2937992 RepID=UPI00203CFA0E|nr:hypothetical protein [Cellulosimicrobium sp. Marseille-Q4280]
MTWTPENVIATAAVGVALVAALLSGVVALTAVRLQQRGDAANRRRDVHLRFWRAANTSLRLLQEREASMQQSNQGKDLPEPAELDPAMQETRATLIEMEIVSPRLVTGGSRVLTALDLARADVQELAVVRARMASRSGRPAGGDFKRAMDAARSDLDAARHGLNDLQVLMSKYDAVGRLPIWRNLARR